jgi:hypothetical protein
MITLSDITEAFKNASKAERKEFIGLILPDLVNSPLFNSTEFKNAVDTSIVLSDQKILPRLRAVEKTTGNYSFEEWEEHDPTLPEQIKELANRLKQPLDKPTESIKVELPIIPSTTLEHKAMKLVERLKVKPRSRTGEVFMDNKDIAKFLTTELPEDLRTEDTNLRRVKKRVIEKAQSLFPDSILINKSKNGRHETRVVLKESYLCNRNGTLV